MSQLKPLPAAIQVPPFHSWDLHGLLVTGGLQFLLPGKLLWAFLSFPKLLCTLGIPPAFLCVCFVHSDYSLLLDSSLPIEGLIEGLSQRGGAQLILQGI